MFVATMDTEHFSWIAFGETEDAAKKALAAGWTVHIAQQDVHPNLAMTGARAVEFYEPNTFEVVPGGCYRDHDLLTGR